MHLVRSKGKVVPIRERKSSVHNIIKNVYHEHSNIKCVAIISLQKDGSVITSWSDSMASDRILMAEVLKAETMKKVMEE